VLFHSPQVKIDNGENLLVSARFSCCQRSNFRLARECLAPFSFRSMRQNESVLFALVAVVPDSVVAKMKYVSNSFLIRFNRLSNFYYISLELPIQFSSNFSSR
jgi:hypothetical protein